PVPIMGNDTTRQKAINNPTNIGVSSSVDKLNKTVEELVYPLPDNDIRIIDNKANKIVPKVRPAKVTAPLTLWDWILKIRFQVTKSIIKKLKTRTIDVVTKKILS